MLGLVSRPGATKPPAARKMAYRGIFGHCVHGPNSAAIGNQALCGGDLSRWWNSKPRSFGGSRVEIGHAACVVKFIMPAPRIRNVSYPQAKQCASVEIPKAHFPACWVAFVPAGFPPARRRCRS